MPETPAATTTPAKSPTKPGAAFEAVIVSQTHWDRAWYMTFQQFRRRLVYVMDRLLDLLETNPGFRTFTFDGQACVLDDYLQIRPENAQRMRELAKQGRLIFGPWFTLPDEWLVSGEAIVRNLLLGRKHASAFGPVNTVGYCPDAFGHANQLPQILAGFDLTAVIFTRGMGDEMDRLGLTFNWISADDETSLLAIHQLGGYGNFSAVGYHFGFVDMSIAEMKLDVAAEQTAKWIEKMRPLTKTRTLLFNNGVDHMEAQFTLPQVIEHINAADLGVTVRHGTYQEFVDAVNAEKPRLESYQGEFHLGRDHIILPGTLSTRIGLKQRNARCQSRLEGHAEPLVGLAQVLGDPEAPDMRPFLHEAWRLLLLTHPHDDICGCSVDQVHREMLPRFDQSEQIAEMIAGEGLRALAGMAGTHAPDALGHVAIFNSAGWTRGGPVEFNAVLPVESVDADAPLHLVAPDGTQIPATISHTGTRETHAYLQFQPVHPQTQCHEWQVRAQVPALPPVGVSVFAIERGAAKASDCVRATDTTLENEHLSIFVNANGSLNVTDRATGRVHEGILFFEDVADVGDEYDFSAPVPGPGNVDTSKAKATSHIIESRGDSASLRITVPFELPAEIDAKRERRVAEKVDSTLNVTLTLGTDSRALDVEVVWANRAKDHRLRAVFPMTIQTDHADAEAHFDVISRPLVPPRPQTKWSQDPVNFHPMDRFVSVSDGKNGLAILGEGIHEYEATPTDAGTRLEVTLLRCVGWLSRGDMTNGRPAGNAGPPLASPEAQCIGPQRLRFAIAPHAGDWFAGEIHRRAVEFNQPLLASQISTPRGDLPPSRSLVTVSDDALVVTACKMSEHRRTAVVRVINMGASKTTGRITAGFGVSEAWLTNLAEDRREKLAVKDGNAVEVSVRPRQLVTVELAPAG